ncbi:MAG: type II toxin-antitoxin system RelE/ParE family toxin [Deltaproteobacteria bacterium]|nr:type II toxin-antitoxin system RelE/ParE family toxin [Deltaproteobacteria bacterium]
MTFFRLDIPRHVAASIRQLHPDLRRSIKAALLDLATRPDSGEPLLRELEGFRKFRVRRYRIVYAVDSKSRLVRVMAVGHRRNIYEEPKSQLSRKNKPPRRQGRQDRS